MAESMTKVFLIHTDGNPTHNAGDNNKSHKVDGNAVNSSGHELSPFHRIANNQGYHETYEKENKTYGKAWSRAHGARGKRLTV